MIYSTKQRAIEVADTLNRELRGYGTYRAARVAEGWTVIQVSPYSQGSVIEYAEVL